MQFQPCLPTAISDPSDPSLILLTETLVCAASRSGRDERLHLSRPLEDLVGLRVAMYVTGCPRCELGCRRLFRALHVESDLIGQRWAILNKSGQSRITLGPLALHWHHLAFGFFGKSRKLSDSGSDATALSASAKGALLFFGTCATMAM